jgi:hypothetical protein
MDALKLEYNDHLDAFGLRSVLLRELALEDDYQKHVRKVLKGVTHRDRTADYESPLAFCGGATAAETALDKVSQMVRTAAQRANLPPRQVFCGLWPSGTFQARSILGSHGGLIQFDVGLWFYLRFACQQVVRSLAAITGSERLWGPDPPAENSGRILHGYLDDYIRDGGFLRERTRLFVMRGPREAFRRDLNFLSISYVIAHEYGHIVADEPGACSPVASTWSEESETTSQRREYEADMCAFRILHEPQFSTNRLAAAMAPVLVLLVHAFALRTQATVGRTMPNWTHLAPEVRAYFALLQMAPENSPTHTASERFRQWLWKALDLEALFRTGQPD